MRLPFITPTQKLKTFQSENSDALSLFTKAVSKLETSNARITEEAITALAKIKDLEDFHSKLLSQHNANIKVVGRIKAIIED